MTGRKAIAVVSVVALAVGTWATVRHGLRHAPEDNSGVAYFWWTVVATPVLGAVALWFGMQPIGVRRRRWLTVGSRLLFGAAAGVAFNAVVYNFTALNVSCYDPTDSGECGFGLFAVVWFAVAGAAVLAVVGLVLWLAARSARS